MTDTAVAGACAGLVSAVLTCPFDVVKTQQQAQGAYSREALPGDGAHAGAEPRTRTRPATARQISARIFAKDGIRGLYRGLGPTVLGYLPTWAIYFSAYAGTKRHLAQSRWGTDMPTVAHMVSAMLAGSACVVITSPLWVVKTRFMVQALPHPEGEVPYRNTLESFVRIYKNEGVGAFYKGLAPSLMGVSHVAVQFPLYDALKREVARRSGRSPDEPLSVPGILFCSSASKMVASCLTYPHEVLRTRLQIPATVGASASASSRRGLLHTICDIWAREGVSGYYQGIGVNMLRTVPNAAVTILTYVSPVHQPIVAKQMVAAN